jgi:hypothetical protein
MLAPSRNTTEQRYQTNALTLESIPGYLFSRRKHRLDASARQQLKAWTESKLLPADVCSPGGLWGPAPLSLSLPGRPERRVFLSLSSSGTTDDTTAKDTAKDSLEAAFQAYVSPSKGYPLPGKLGGTSEPLQAPFSSRTSSQDASSLRTSLSSLHQPQQMISQAWQAGDTSEPLRTSFSQAHNGARRVEASEPAKPPPPSPDVFSSFPSHDVAVLKLAKLLHQA